jgi:hypothetical protein
MTWWEDLLAQYVDLFTGATPDFLNWLTNIGGTVPPDSWLGVVAGAVGSLFKIIVVIMPYAGFIFTLYLIDILLTAIITGDIKPVGNLLLRVFEIIVSIGSAIAEAIPL